MFEARLTNASILKKVLEAVKDLLNEGTWDCTENGMALQAMDTSHVTLVSVKLDAVGFEEYRCDRSCSLGLHLINMSKIMKCAGADDSVTIRNQDESDTITFLFESPNSERQSEFEIKLMDLDVEHLGIPETDYNCVIKLSSAEFRRIVTDLAQIGDTLQICCAKGGVSFTAKGDLGSGCIRLSSNASADKEEDTVSIDLKEPVSAAFAIKYLSHFTKATQLSTMVTLSLSSDVPLVVEYKVEEMGYIRYFLAPKIEESSNN